VSPLLKGIPSLIKKRRSTAMKIIVNQEDIKEIINSGMRKLEKKDHEILYELYYNNTSLHQLSKKLGADRSTLRYRRGRALNNLKKIITKSPK
jgi:DNA-directed RNA polymerase specialized sigma subunit